jgi:excisionase family DNA binding protein
MGGMSTTQQLFDIDDAAKILLLSARRIRALVRDGQLPHVVLPGGEIRFVPADLSRFVESLKRPAAEGGKS